MKRLAVVLTISTVFLYGLVCCKKEAHMPVLNVTLYDKPVDTIRHYLQGNWQLHYGKGGFIANMIHYYENAYWEFSSDSEDRIRQTYDNDVVADTTIEWYRETDGYAGLTHVMKFYDRSGVPLNYVAVEIRNDTLIIKDYSSDAIFYHFTKQNH